MRGRGDTGIDVVERDSVVAPAPASGSGVQERRLDPVQSAGKAGVFAVAGLEFVPEAAQFRCEVGWQQAEDPVRRGLLGRRLRHGIVIAVDRRVAGVDLDNVMD